MFEKFLDTIGRIATALERIAAYQGSPAVKVTNNSTAAEAGAPSAGKAATTKASTGKSATTTKADTKPPKEDDGLGGADESESAITFEQMRKQLVDVKMLDKLGKTKSDAILAKYGKLNEIKESDYPACVAECNKLLKSVGA
jgi:hypothetical protein